MIYLEDHPGEFLDEMPPLDTLGSATASAFGQIEAAGRIARYTESPIETMLGVALYSLLDENWEMIPQFKWRRYRIDWCLRRAGRPDIFIECDGREFHTKPEQVMRDRCRDAEIAQAGIKIFRFTGSEIFRNPKGCAMRVYFEARK